jgi:hypothetical protein
VIDLQYRQKGRRFRRCHPRDVISIAVDLINFERLTYALSPDLIHRAFDLKFIVTDFDED